MRKDTTQVDHKAEALRLIDCAVENGKETGEKPEPALFFLGALVRSNLAIAEGQERVAEAVRDLVGEVHELTRGRS